MNRTMTEQRKHARFAGGPSSIAEGIPPHHAMIVNVSQGGACLCLSDLPPAEQGLALRFRWDGRDHVLRSRVVWSRRCLAMSDRENPSPAKSWLAGIAFSGDGEGAPFADSPLDILRAGHIMIRSLPESPVAGAREKNGKRKQAPTPEVISFSDQSILSAKKAANDLLPVLAKHFSSVQMVFTRDRFEVSASFRPLAELSTPETRRRTFHAVEAVEGGRPPVASPVEQPALLVQANEASAGVGRQRSPVMVAGLAALLVGGMLIGVWPRADGGPDPLRATSTRPSTPQWATGLDPASLAGWIAVQRRFKLTDAAVRDAIRVLRSNDKYAAGQLLHNLASYPVEVGRAFSLIAGRPTARPAGLRQLKTDLQARVVQGSRFPDEVPGGRYSSLQRELFANVVVLAVIEFLDRHRGDPDVKAVLAAVQQG